MSKRAIRIISIAMAALMILSIAPIWARADDDLVESSQEEFAEADIPLEEESWLQEAEPQDPLLTAEENDYSASGFEEEAVSRETLEEDIQEIQQIQGFPEPPIPLTEAPVQEPAQDDAPVIPEEPEIPIPQDKEPEEEKQPPVEEEPEPYREPLFLAKAKTGAVLRVLPDGMSPIVASTPGGTQLPVMWQSSDWYAVNVDVCVFGDDCLYAYKDDIEIPHMGQKKLNQAYDEREEPLKKVTIFSSQRVSSRVGDEITITSKLEGFDGYNVTYIWKVDKGNGFEVVEGATDPEYTFTASAESFDWEWQLAVSYR